MARLEHGAKGLSLSQKTGQPRRPHRSVLLGYCVVGLQLLGCESKVVIASFSCPAPSTNGLAGTAGTAGSSGTSESFDLPWSSSFEYGFCDFMDGRGSWVVTGSADKGIVTEPVHSGTYAAAFIVDAAKGGQARCIREGTLPIAAYYGAWYYVPVLAKITNVWNLTHFQGATTKEDFHWDITLRNTDSGALRLDVFSYLFRELATQPVQSNHPPIPIGSWFHVEMYLKRAADQTGEVRVYQDGQVIFQLTNIVTDNSNSTWGQWFVGNLADSSALDPSESTLYVDDVTISATR